jgi:hypothetical protein
MPMDHKDQCLHELMQSNSLAHSCLLGQPCNKWHENWSSEVNLFQGKMWFRHFETGLNLCIAVYIGWVQAIYLHIEYVFTGGTVTVYRCWWPYLMGVDSSCTEPSPYWKVIVRCINDTVAVTIGLYCTYHKMVTGNIPTLHDCFQLTFSLLWSLDV